MNRADLLVPRALSFGDGKAPVAAFSTQAHRAIPPPSFATTPPPVLPVPPAQRTLSLHPANRQSPLTQEEIDSRLNLFQRIKARFFGECE